MGFESLIFLTDFSVNGSSSSSIVNESIEIANPLLECNSVAPKIFSAGSEEHSNHQAKPMTMLNNPSRSTFSRKLIRCRWSNSEGARYQFNLSKGD